MEKGTTVLLWSISAESGISSVLYPKRNILKPCGGVGYNGLIDEQFIKNTNKVKNLPLLKAAMVYLVFFAGAAMVRYYTYSPDL